MEADPLEDLAPVLYLTDDGDLVGWSDPLVLEILTALTKERTFRCSGWLS